MTLQLYRKLKAVNPEFAEMYGAAVDLPRGHYIRENPAFIKIADFLANHGELLLGHCLEEPGDTVEEARLWLKKQIDLGRFNGGNHGLLSVRVTPALSTALLERNTKNRRVRDRERMKIRNALIKGEWKHNGQPIILSISGVLLDGQHRLLEIEFNNIAAVCDIRFGIADDAFDSMDNGGPRTVSDVLGIDGEVNTTSLGATMRLIWSVNHGILSVDSIVGQDHFSNSYAREMAKITENIDECVLLGINANTKFGGSVAGFAAAAHFIQLTHGLEKAQEFFDNMLSGALEPGYATMKFRDYLLSQKSAKGTRGTFARNRHDPLKLTANMVRAFNGYMKNTKKHESWKTEDGFPAVFSRARK